jgi:Lrp/AsnC family leucine-responsive transcriptional regulator
LLHRGVIVAEAIQLPKSTVDRPARFPYDLRNRFCITVKNFENYGILGMIDEIDMQILMLLQENGRLANAAIAEQVGLTTSTVFERIKKLEKRGVIQRYVAVIDPVALGKPITAFVRLVLGADGRDHYLACKRQFAEVCQAEPDVLECHTVAGEDCYILKVRVASTGQLEELIERLRSTAPITKSTTNIVLSTFKEETKVSNQ